MATDRSGADEPWRRRIAEAVAWHGQLARIGRAARMPSQQLKKIADGTTKDPSINTLARIAKAMNLSLAELVSEPRPEGEAGRASSLPQELAATVGPLVSREVREALLEVFCDMLAAIASDELERAIARRHAAAAGDDAPHIPPRGGGPG